MYYQDIIYTKKEGIATITLNRPDKLNAVSLELRTEFLQVLGELEEDDQVGVVIVTGAGRAFCAGADISEFGIGEADWRRRQTVSLNAVKQIYEFPKPMIGAINGVAAGDGSQWVLAFDLNIASENAKFAWPATRLGLL